MKSKEPGERSNRLGRKAEEVAEANNFPALEKALQEFNALLEEPETMHVNLLALNSFCGNVCAKILTAYVDRCFSVQAERLVVNLKEMGLLPPVYLSLFDHILAKNPLTQLKLNNTGKDTFIEFFGLMNNTERLDLFQKTVSELIEYNHDALHSASRNYGYSLLDVAGNFIWSDERSQRVFEQNSWEVPKGNLFDLMIPFSRRFLKAKFGDCLFAENPKVGSSQTFSYVIYSKTSMNQYYKCLKRIGFKNEEELKQQLGKASEPNSIYHQYLRTLSSRATIIVLKFTKAQFKNIVETKEPNLNVASSIGDLMKQLADCGQNGEQSAEHSKKKLTSKEKQDMLHGRVDPFEQKVDFQSKNPKNQQRNGNIFEDILEVNRMNQEGSEIVLMNAILLETRYSANFPEFNYQNMKNDPVIVDFEERIFRKIREGKCDN